MRRPRTTRLWVDLSWPLHTTMDKRTTCKQMEAPIVSLFRYRLSFVCARNSCIMAPLLQKRRRKRRISTCGLLTVTDARPSSTYDVLHHRHDQVRFMMHRFCPATLVLFLHRKELLHDTSENYVMSLAKQPAVSLGMLGCWSLKAS
jgi:hypothetical protein